MSCGLVKARMVGGSEDMMRGRNMAAARWTVALCDLLDVRDSHFITSCLPNAVQVNVLHKRAGHTSGPVKILDT